MANKTIYIDTIHVGYANKAEISPEISNADPIKTFDGPIPSGSSEISWNVTIDKLRYGTVAEYKQLEALLLSMLNNPKSIKIVEKTNGVDGPLKVKTIVYKCNLNDKKYTLDAESETVENLSFKGTSMREWVNDEEIKY